MDKQHENTDVLKCSNCGFVREILESRCPECGSLNSKLDDMLAREEAEREHKSLKGKVKIIWQAPDRKAELLHQLSLYKQTLPDNAMVVLVVIFVFIFALVISVM